MFFGDPFVDPLSESHCNVRLRHKKIDQVQVQFRQFVIALIFLILHFFSDFEETFRIVSYSFLVLSLSVALFQVLMPSLELVA